MKGCVWISSDLQLHRADLAREVLQNAVEDVLRLEIPLTEAWCLGDALVGARLEALEHVADASVELYERLGVPICYVMGNHEMDLQRKSRLNRFPLYDRVRNRPGWQTMNSRSDAFFVRDVLGHRVFFMGDHAAEDGSWWTTAGRIYGDEEKYPHPPDAFVRLRAAIAESSLPVLTASHYAFQGGQRPNPLQDLVLPLPPNVRAHFHGHAHIGDLVWNRDNPWMRSNPIAHSERRQFNVSALETERTEGSHSAFLFFEDDGSLSIRFRCHQTRKWLERFSVEG